MGTIRTMIESAWERGATAGVFAQAYEGAEIGDDGTVLAPDGILSGEWAGDVLPVDVARMAGIVDDVEGYDTSEACDAYEAAYAAGFVALYMWADSDDDEPAPTVEAY